MKTKRELLGYIFDEPLENFNVTKPPTMGDVIRRWIFVYDQKRGDSKRISPTLKDELIDEIVVELINVWQNLSREVDVKKEVRRIVRQAIIDAEKLAKNLTKKDENDKAYVQHHQERFNVPCNIRPPTPRKSNTKVSETVEEEVSTPLGKRQKKCRKGKK